MSETHTERGSLVKILYVPSPVPFRARDGVTRNGPGTIRSGIHPP